MDALVLDISTPETGLVLQERTIVSVSARVAQALRVCAESGRECALVTPRSSRLTLPLRSMIGPGVRWAVRGEGGESYFDGLNGASLEWDGERFVPGGGVHPGFEKGEADGRWLVVTATVRHPASDGLRVGHAVELLSTALTGAPPAGWGAAEPASTSWSASSVTEYCRRRAPKRTWAGHVGGGVGTLQVVRTDGGVEERVMLGASVAVPDMAALAEALAGRFPLVSMTAQRVPGRRDLTAEPRWCGVPEPVGVAVDGRWREAPTWERFREVLEGEEGGAGRWALS